LKSLLFRLWHSPTFMTWGSLASRLLGLTLVLPLVLVKFPAADVAVWQLFTTILTLQLILDFGLSPTFSRMLSYAVGGATVQEMADMRQPRPSHGRDANWPTLRAVWGAMQWLYIRMGLAVLALTAVVGTWALNKPVSQMSDAADGWLAWGIVLASSLAAIAANGYSAALQGFNQIATLRRWEIATSLAQIASSFTVVSLGGGVLALVLVNQSWVVFGAWRNRRLLLQSQPQLADCSAAHDAHVIKALWPATWRSGVGILMSQGIIQASGVVYSQLAPAAEVASYLLALRVVTTISQFSQAPFYSKLPTLNTLHAKGQVQEQLRVSRKGMALASVVFVAGVLAVSVVMQPALQHIGSKVQFVSPTVWALMGWAFFIERVGAMHIQLYSVTNHIIWHWLNGVTGALMLGFAWLLYPALGLAAFPVAMLIAYAGFYTLVAMRRSSRTFHFNLFSFEAKASLPPALVLMACTWAVMKLN
jgi:hypothetical protein